MAKADLVAIIHAKQAQFARLQAELDEARTALAAIVGEPARTPRRSDARARAQRRFRRSAKRLTASPTAEAAARVLRTARRPLHISEIQKRMKAHGRSMSASSIVGTLSRWVRSRAVFYRDKPNVFGLLEFRRKR